MCLEYLEYNELCHQTDVCSQKLRAVIKGSTPDNATWETRNLTAFNGQHFTALDKNGIGSENWSRDNPKRNITSWPVMTLKITAGMNDLLFISFQ